MANYFVKDGNVLQMRPVVPVGFRRGAQEKAKAADSKASDSPPVVPPDPGLPAVRRRNFRPLIALVILGWAFFIALGAVVRWVVS